MSVSYWCYSTIYLGPLYSGIRNPNFFGYGFNKFIAFVVFRGRKLNDSTIASRRKPLLHVELAAYLESFLFNSDSSSSKTLTLSEFLFSRFSSSSNLLVRNSRAPSKLFCNDLRSSWIDYMQ